MKKYEEKMLKQKKINYIIIIATILCVYLIISDGVLMDFDTVSYVRAWDNLKSGEIDLWRTPSYPIILGILKCCLGDYFMWATIIIQFITFIISIKYFYIVAGKLIDNEIIVISITAFYALYPCIPTWNNYILTESFAVYGIIFFLYYIIKVYVDKSIKYHIHLLICILFLIFLRPAIIFIIPILLLILCILGFKLSWAKTVRYGFISLFGVCTCLSGYIYLYQKKYGLSSPTAVGVLNNYYIARMDGKIKPEMTNNPSLSLYIEKSIKEHGEEYTNGSGYDLGREGINAIQTYGPKNVSNLISKSNFNSISEQTKRFFHHIRKASQDKLFSTYNPKWNLLSDITCLRMNTIYYLLLIHFLFLTYWMYRRKKIAWFSIFLFLLGVGHLFIILYTCQNIWYRLIIPFTPVYLLMAGQLLNTAKVKNVHKMLFI